MEKKKREKTKNEPRIYYEDLVIAQALLNKDRRVTTEFYYKGCYPIFQSLWKNYKTGCESPLELMNQVYMLILYPSIKTGKCQLENYRGESTLRSWIKTVALYHCFGVYGDETIPEEENEDDDDRIETEKVSMKRVVNSDFTDFDTVGSEEMDMTNMIKDDAMRLISLMPNKRYAEVVRLFKIEDYTNTKVAEALGITKANLCNVKHRAMEQFELICRREEQNV